MPGLPKAPSQTPPRDAFAVMVLGGVENLTHALRRGDAFSERALRDMEKLQRRLEAFSAALNARKEVFET